MRPKPRILNHIGTDEVFAEHSHHLTEYSAGRRVADSQQIDSTKIKKRALAFDVSSRSS